MNSQIRSNQPQKIFFASANIAERHGGINLFVKQVLSVFHRELVIKYSSEIWSVTERLIIHQFSAYPDQALQNTLNLFVATPT
jgi:hypothetical protein